MVQDLGAALRTRSRVLAFATDPDMDAEVKLFAFCLQAYLIGRDQPGGWRSQSWAEVVGAMMERPDSLALKSLGPEGVCRRAIAKDLPRYEPPVADGTLACPSLKARGPLAGQPCGKPATQARMLDRHPLTGEAAWVGYCPNHSHPALDQWRHERLVAWDANGRPSPPANTGGALKRHFRGPWQSVYRWAATWPAAAPETPMESLPRFTLIDGEGMQIDTPRAGRADLGAVITTHLNG